MCASMVSISHCANWNRKLQTEQALDEKPAIGKRIHRHDFGLFMFDPLVKDEVREK